MKFYNLVRCKRGNAGNVFRPRSLKIVVGNGVISEGDIPLQVFRENGENFMEKPIILSRFLITKFSQIFNIYLNFLSKRAEFCWTLAEFIFLIYVFSQRNNENLSWISSRLRSNFFGSKGNHIFSKIRTRRIYLALFVIWVVKWL